jgi:hypothetical protein
MIIASVHAAASRNGVFLGIYATLSSRVVMARPGTGLLASGIREKRAFPEVLCRLQWLTPEGARELLHPVTVAGPRRTLTGLPLTTDRYVRGESIRDRVVSERRSPAV